ncbi:MAG: cytidine deaminase [Bacteroidaceae bacterium]|jgi:cytidine deaminase|nr:cytidine deaminase [Bacteroidaceae bacterium]
MKEYTIQSRVCVYGWDELSPEDRILVEAAKDATNGSYAPYSGFCVGAAARLKNGTVVIGSNQENVAYPSGLCAERTTLFAANAQNPDQPVVALAIAARNKDGFLSQPITPCGACRQVISGVEQRYNQPIRILLYGTDGTHVIESIDALLPLQFVDSYLDR